MSSGAGAGEAEDDHAARIDKWLWCVRLFRSRALATEACRSGAVTVNGLPAKPSRTVRAGEVYAVKVGVIERTVAVLGTPPSRVGAPLVAGYMEDRTPPEVWERARRALPVERILARPPGSGRPTKRDRRQLDTLFER